MTERLTPEAGGRPGAPGRRGGHPARPRPPGRRSCTPSARATDWDDLLISGALLVDLYEVFGQPGVRFLSGFFGPAERFMRDQGGAIEFVPADFRRFAPVLERIDPRVMATAAAPPDADGWCSLSLHAGATVDELERAARDPDRVLVVEVNPHSPAPSGLGEHRHRIHVDEHRRADRDRARAVRARRARSRRPRSGPSPSYAAGFVTDGCTLQTGIGGIPSTVASLLADGDGGDYGIHSEMFTTGLMQLHQAGKVTNRKGIYDGVLGHHVRRRHPRALRLARRQRGGAVPARSTW